MVSRVLGRVGGTVVGGDHRMNVTIYDNCGRTFDRNGFCMSLSPGDYIEGPHLGKKIMLENITEPARKAVLAELEWAEKESQR